MSTLRQSLHERRAEEVAAVCCVLAEERQAAVILAAWKGETWVLPWAQFVSARLVGERIDLSFASCLVIITGENLRALLDDLAAYRIGVLRELPLEYRLKLADGEPFVSRIEVQEEARPYSGEDPASPESTRLARASPADEGR